MFKDLQPYMCTYEDCAKPGKLYDNQHDWYEHEVRVHRREWYCGACSKSFHNRAHMEEHLNEAHPRIVAMTRIEVVLSICERARSSEEVCQFCGDHIKDYQYREHIGGHMEEATLFTLQYVTEKVGQEAVSEIAQGQQAKGRHDSLGNFVLEFNSDLDSGRESYLDGQGSKLVAPKLIAAELAAALMRPESTHDKGDSPNPRQDYISRSSSDQESEFLPNLTSPDSQSSDTSQKSGLASRGSSYSLNPSDWVELSLDTPSPRPETTGLENSKAGLPEDEGVGGEILPSPGTRSHLPCPFRGLDGCEVMFDVKESGLWEFHSMGHFQGIKPPMKLACTFGDPTGLCAEVFLAEDDDKRIFNWSKKMKHVAKHYEGMLNASHSVFGDGDPVLDAHVLSEASNMPDKHFESYVRRSRRRLEEGGYPPPGPAFRNRCPEGPLDSANATQYIIASGRRKERIFLR